MAAGWGVEECIRTALEDILHDVRRWFPLVCWFRRLVRVRISGAAVVAVVDGGGPVVVIGGGCGAVQGGVMEIVVGG